MPEHTLPAGRNIIEGLAALGRALGYHVETEMPVEEGRRNPAAVDVAWLAEQGQRFPLFIFEVESRVTNSIANNPLKVFAPPNQEFEKPLFFFHLMVEGGEGTSRVDNLRRQYGSQNYRAYNLAQSEATQLVKDVLSQHRRLKSEIRLEDVLAALASIPWSDLDIDSTIEHVESLGFSGRFLGVYAKLGFSDDRLRRHYLRYLSCHKKEESVIVGRRQYTSYLGNTWAVPIHIAILSHAAIAGADKVPYLGALRQWQEEWSFMTMIGPHFGLSRDYDGFIFGIAPTLWALVAALMHDDPEAVRYLALQSKYVLEKLTDAEPHFSFFTAVWLLHVASSTDKCLDLYELAQKHIAAGGGISEGLLYSPPGALQMTGDSPTEITGSWDNDLQTDPVEVPSIDEFRRNTRRLLTENGPDAGPSPLTLAFRALLDDQTLSMWQTDLLRLLHR